MITSAAQSAPFLPPLPVHDGHVSGLVRIQELTPRHWLVFFGVITIFILVVKAIQAYRNSGSKMLIGAFLMVFGAITFMNWAYSRTEPKFLTPFMDRAITVLWFLPEQGSFEKKSNKTGAP